MNNGRPQRRASPTEMWIYFNPVDWSYQGSHDRGFQGERRLRSCRYAFYERHMMKKYILAMAVCLAAVATPVLATDFKVEEATIPEIEQAFRDHRLTCHQLVQTYFDRIAAYDKQGPKLDAVLALNGSALAAADLLDNSFAHGGKLGALHCVPVVLKDNYNTTDLPTTGGSLSLEGAHQGRLRRRTTSLGWRHHPGQTAFQFDRPVLGTFLGAELCLQATIDFEGETGFGQFDCLAGRSVSVGDGGTVFGLVTVSPAWPTRLFWGPRKEQCMSDSLEYPETQKAPEGAFEIHTASFAALTGRALTIFRAGLALNIIGSPLKGFVPARALVAGFFMTTNLANPGTRKMPVFFSSL
jgi:hypothetical protein